MKKLLVIVVIIILAIFFALFSDIANEEAKPYISKFIESNLADSNLSVEIEEYRLDSDHITISAKINQNSRVKIYGDLNLFSQQFNLKYTIDSIEQPLNIRGIAEGSIEDIYIKGEGVALSSNLNYEFEFKEQRPQNIQVDIKDARIEEILKLIGEPLYAKGLFELNIDMPKIEKNGGYGDARLVLHETLLNSKVILREQGVVLPPKTTLDGIVVSKLNGIEASIDGDIKSNLANLLLKNGRFNIETQALFSEFVLDIKELKKLESITNTNLNGALKLTGEIEKKEKDIEVSILTKSLGGELALSMIKDNLKIDMSRVEIDRLLLMLNQPKYLKGELNSKIRVENLKNPKGTIELSILDAIGVNSVLNRELDLELREPLKISLDVDGDIENNQINSRAKIDSSIVNLIMENIIYSIKESKLDADYRLSIPKLSKLKEFVGKTLKGSMEIVGELKKDKELVITGATDSFDGKIDFTMMGDKLNANLKEVPVKKLLYTLQYPLIFSAPLSGELEYDMRLKRGQLTTQLPNAKLLKNQLTDMVKQFSGIDLTDDVYNQTKFDAKIVGDTLDFNLLAKNSRNKISIYRAKLDKQSNHIDAKYHLILDKKDIGGTIKGDVNSPHVTIDSSKFLKKKLKNVVEKYIDKSDTEKIKNRLKDFGLDEEQSDKAINKATNFIRDFF